MTTNEEARVAKARSEAMNAYPAERFEQALSAGAVRAARRHAFERGYLAALAAAPDHQAEAPSDLAELLIDAKEIARHQRLVFTQDGDALHVKIAEVLEELHAALAARPVVDDAAVERAARAMYAITNQLSMSGARDMARAALRAALGGDQ